MSGSGMGDDEALAYAKQYFPDRNYCLVRDWRWLDLEVTERQRLQLAQTGRQPALIYAHTVIYDSERRWDVGDFVRTSLLHQHEGFHFKTLNSVYLLLGPGTRIQTSSDVVASIF
ncbi:conserved hypothetical protein [Pseudomonas sp. 8AS]|uniref:DUF6957 family protein n=1 Tax=Pseudomonas sp. 8AS TaxID=2653163 RepID=UPI0012F03938|nr:hypothetical protein [Pseudomonas sp. 8AS]VXC14579.1 conserved hypothetical protein [Pseudomonas sp. 8AS]